MHLLPLRSVQPRAPLQELEKNAFDIDSASMNASANVNPSPFEESTYEQAVMATMTTAVTQSLTINPVVSSTGFRGLTHFEQRNANGGNQYSIEPPSPSIAVGNGYILEGVNNAIQVYTSAGRAVLPRVLSTNELFGVPPAIDRPSGIVGVNPTDMRVFYDQTMSGSLFCNAFWTITHRVLPSISLISILR